MHEGCCAAPTSHTSRAEMNDLCLPVTGAFAPRLLCLSCPGEVLAALHGATELAPLGEPDVDGREIIPGSTQRLSVSAHVSAPVAHAPTGESRQREACGVLPAYKVPRPRPRELLRRSRSLSAILMRVSNAWSIVTVHVERSATQRTRHIWLVLRKLGQDGLQQAGFAESVPAHSADRLPERVPANGTREVGERWIVDVLLELSKKLFGRL